MEKQGKLFAGIVGGVTMFVLLAGIAGLFAAGPLGEILVRRETLIMGAELLGTFLLFWFVLEKCKRNASRNFFLIVIIVVFTWCHQIFLPLLIALAYVLYLILLGRCIRKVALYKLTYEMEFQEKMAVNFMVGCAAVIAGICILSLFGVGDIFLIRKIILLSGVLLFSLAIVEEVEEEVPKHYMMVGRKQRLFLSIAAAMVFLQAGRINIAMDYDTLHYSVRSQYVLNAGLGIYENLGMNNVVYTYPKGLEILTMPFADLKSYSYIPAFNLWVTVGTLVCIYMLVRHLSSRRAAWRTVAVAACIPAIMNMGASAKTDAITLFFQLMAIYFVMQYMREKRQPYLLMGGSALILSYAMKPTAVVFSSLVLVVSVVCLVKHKLVKIRLADRWWILVIPEVLALIGVWARTFFLTGVPVTSVFTGLLNKIGFKLRYPFNAAEVPNSGGELLSAEGWINLVKRLFGVLIAPVGEDMAHVVIAWGSGLILVFLVVIVLARRMKTIQVARVREHQHKYVCSLMTVVGLASIVSLRMLWQVDGNYFMLFYCLVVVEAMVALDYFTKKTRLEIMPRLAAPMLLLNVVVMMCTNWAGAVGFSPVNLVHSGYFDHRAKAHQDMIDSGNAAIWNMLEVNPRTRLLAVGEEPEVLSFPCIAQTYNDMSGSGGDVHLVKTLAQFKEYLDWAKIDFIYVQAGFVEPGSRVWDILCYMLEDGSLTDLRTEHGNAIGTVDLDGEPSEDARRNLEYFKEAYYAK